MSTPEEIARKWANKIQSLTLADVCEYDLKQIILQAAAEMARESGAVGVLQSAISSEAMWRKLEDDDRSRHGAELAYEGNYEPKEFVECIARLREITKYGEK